MSKKQETIADIVVKMRNPCDNNICPYWEDGGDCASCPLGGSGKNCIFANMADRIEAAHKRDVDAYDLINFMSPVGRVKPAHSGNGAKMREAVDGIKNTANSALTALSFGNDTSSYLWDIIRECTAALAEPPRNCDVGTVDEQTERFVNFARLYFQSEVVRFAMNWAQMPHEEGGAK